MSKTLPKGQKVRYTDAFIQRQSPATQSRFAGRVGEVTGYRMGAIHPIVDFPKVGRLKAQKLFEVNTRDLELVKDAQSGAESAQRAKVKG